MYDGSDVHESVLLLLALEEAGERPVLLAPDIRQGRTVDHLSAGTVEGEDRNVLCESARLGRGIVRALATVRPDELEALVIPGGYGPVVNFSGGFAMPGAARRILPEVEPFLQHFLMERKPLGLIGLGEVPVRTLLGQEMEPPSPPADPRHLRVDADRRIVHTPGFAAFTRLADVRAGIEAMVAALLRLMEERTADARTAGETGKAG